MPQEKLPLILELDPLDDHIVKIGDRAKDILLARLGDGYTIDAVDDDFFSWEIRHADTNGVVGGYFYCSNTQTWTRTNCHQEQDETLVAPAEIRELVRAEVNHRLWVIKGLASQGAIA